MSNHGRARITQRTPAAQEDRMEMLSLLDIFTHEQRILRLIYETLHMVKSHTSSAKKQLCLSQQVATRYGRTQVTLRRSAAEEARVN